MKRKITKILGVGLTLALLTSMLITGAPVAAQETLNVIPFELGAKNDEEATAEWSTVEEIAVLLVTGPEEGDGDTATIAIHAADVGISTLGDVVSISWDEYLVSGYPAHVDIMLDTNGDETVDDALVIEYAYNEGSHPSVTESSNAWLTSRDPGPLGADADVFAYHTLGEWKAGITVAALGSWIEKTIDGNTSVLALEVEVDNWIEASESYIDDIKVNGTIYFGSIQDAIDAALPGDTITVAAGTYYETIDVTVDGLTLQSLSGKPSDTIIDADGADHTVVSILGSNVTFSGFTVTGAIGVTYADYSYQGNSGIYMDDVEGCHLSNLIIDDISRETDGFGIGIFVHDSSDNIFELIDISNIVGGVSAGQIFGILVKLDSGGSHRNSFTDITIDTITTENPGMSSAVGIMSWGQNNDNTFDTTEITNLTAPQGACGIRGDGERNSFTSTEISSLTAPSAYGILLEFAVDNTFEGTTISNIAGSNIARGVYLRYGGCDDHSFTSTDISGLTGATTHGIYITDAYGGPASNSFSGGSISGAQYGVYVEGDCPFNSIHYTTIVDNTLGVFSDISELDATLNWWGDPTGPSGEEGSGSGDSVSANVNFRPWLDAPYPTGISRAFNVENIDTLSTYDTIEAAIDATLTLPGDTIEVAAGTYDEAVLIDKKLTLLGAQYDVDPTVEGARIDELAESIIDAGGLSAVVTITADSVIVNGFTITNGGGGAPSHLRGGVYLSGTLVSGCTISNNKIIENLRDGIDSCSSGSGVNVFENNVISDNGYGAVYLGRNEGGDIFRNNVISYNADGGGTGQIGIQSSDNIVEGNTINGDTYCGIMIMGSSVDIRKNNILRGNIINRGESGPGFSSYGIGIAYAENTLMEDNIIHNNVGGLGVFQDVDTTSLRGNDVQGNEWGLKVGSDSGDTKDTTIEQNDILNNDVGIWIRSATAASTTHINLNNIVDNPIGVLNEILTTVDATNNWWRNASGPTHADSPFGIGDEVSGDVDYNPWLLVEVVSGEPLPPTYNKTLALKDGWTLVSVDKLVADSAWVVGGESVAYTYTPTGGFESEVTTADLEPLSAIYVKTAGGGGIGINYPAAPDPSVYSKELEAGWNLIGIPSTLAATGAILSPLRYVTIGTQQVVGLTTLVSQSEYNQFSGSFYEATLTETHWDTLPILDPFDGYWAYMEAADTFEVIPD